MRVSGDGKAFSILGQGLSEAAGDLASMAQNRFQTEQHIREITIRQQNVMNELEEQKMRQIEALQGKKLISQLRTDWNERLRQYQENPAPDLMNTARSEYDKYVTKLLEGINSPDVRSEVELHAGEYKIGFLNDTYRIYSQQQLEQFGATFDSMVTNAEDAIFSTKSYAEVNAQKTLLNKTIDDAVSTKQIKDKTTIQNLRDKVNLLSISWADANLPTNPELVKTVIGDTELSPGLSAQHRAVILNKADDVIKTKDSQGKLLLREALQSDIKQRITTGNGNSLDLKKYRAVFGDDMANAAERDLANASKLFSYTQQAMGASDEALSALLKQATPKEDPSSPLYGEQRDLYEHVERVVKQAKSDKEDDAFSYFANNPALKTLLVDTRTNPTPENFKKLQEAVLELQQMDKGLQPYQYRIMPKAQAEKFIEDFNKLVAVNSKADGDSVLSALAQFTSQFGDKTHIALQQLNQTKGGEKIAPKINPLMWHMNKPALFRAIVDAIRKDPTEQYGKFESDKVRINFLSELKGDSNMLSYDSSMRASNNSSETATLVEGVRQTFRDYARDYVLNGGTIKDASALFFSNYNWGARNGVTYARPITYKDELGNEHTMSEEQVNLSNTYLDFWPETVDPADINPVSILNQVEHFTSKELLKDTATALRVNTFWSTTEDETGVYLFTKGSILGEPRQVFYKDGTPVRLNFKDTMKSVPKVPFSGKKSRYEEKTGDTLLDRLANSILTSG